MTACHPERLRALVPFCVHVLHIRGITQINALPSLLWRDKRCPRGAPPHPLHTNPSPALTKASAYLPTPPPHPPYPAPFLPSRPCLRASPLEGQVNRGPGPAQARLVPIRSLIRHFISCLTACSPAAKALWVCVLLCARVCVCTHISVVWRPWDAKHNKMKYTT